MNLLMHCPVIFSMTPDDFAFDYSQKISGLSMAAMVIGIILALLVPILLFVYVKRRFRLQPVVALYSLLAYMLGCTLLPNVVSFGLQFIDYQTGIFTASPSFYYLIVSLSMGLFSLLCIWFAFRLLKKRNAASLGNSVLFAITMIVVPIFTQTITAMTQYLSIASTINKGGLYDIIANMIENESSAEDISSLLEAISGLVTSSPMYFIAIATDVLLLSFIHMGTCVTCGGIAGGKIPSEKKWFAVLPEICYAAALYFRYSGLMESTLLAELAYIIVAVISCGLAWKISAQYMPDELERLLGKPDPSINDDDKRKSSGHKMPKIVMPKD